MNEAALVLEDGTVFEGRSVGAEGFTFGEAVFTTSMSGYQEVATDPSFEGPTTAAIAGNRLLVVNSQFSGPGTPPFTVSSIPLP